MKKQILNYMKSEIEAKKKSLNSLDGDAKELMEQTIADLQARYDELESAEDPINIQETIDNITAIVDEKIKAAIEKLQTEKPIEKMSEEYLNSKNALHDFAECMRKSKTAEEFKSNWNAVLKNEITTNWDSDAFLPAVVKSIIETTWNEDTAWLQQLNNTGAKRFALRFTDTPQYDENVMANGHKRGNAKKEQQVALSDTIINADVIYKIQSIDNKTVYDDDQALVEWVMKELVSQLRYTIAYNILIGNRPAGADDLLYSFTPMTSIAPTYTYNTGLTTIENIMNLIEGTYNGMDSLLFIGKKDYFDMRKYLAAAGGTPTYFGKEALIDMLGVKDIIISNVFEAAPNTRAILMHPDAYYTVGNFNDVSFINWEDYMTNKQMYRAEVYAGGAPSINAGGVLYNE